MGFVFRLESILRLRVHAEHEQQRVVASAQLKLRNFQQQLASVESQIDSAAGELRHHVREKDLDARWLLLHAHHTQSLRSQAAAISDEIFHAGLALTTAQEQLVIATAQRKSLEKLRERDQEQFEAEEARRERRVHDEIAARQARPRIIGQTHPL